MTYPVLERPLDVPFGQPPSAEHAMYENPVSTIALNAGDVIRSQYDRNPAQFMNNMPTLQNTFGSMFGFFPGGNILQQLYQMLQQMFSNGGETGEHYFQNANGGSVGDPHLSFNGRTWDNMGSQPDLLHSDSFAGGYQLSTQTTAPDARGITYNQSATVTTNDGSTSVTLDKEGNATVSQFGNTFALQSGESVDLGNGEFVQRNADGSLQITCNNGTGGNITTTMTSNGSGVNVTTNANNVDLGGALVNGPNAQLTPAPLPMPTPAPPFPRDPFACCATPRGKQQRQEHASMVATIRQAVLADVDRLVPLFDAYRSFFAGDKPVGSKEFLTERLTKNDATFLMSFDGETASGFLTLYPLFSSWHATTIWFLSDLYVAPEYRGQSRGRELVAVAQAFARERSSRSIMVEIPHREPHLVRFYQSLGFQRDKDFDLYRYYMDR